VDGMDVALLVSAAIAMAGMLLAVAFVPGRVAAVARREEPVALGS